LDAVVDIVQQLLQEDRTFLSHAIACLSQIALTDGHKKKVHRLVIGDFLRLCDPAHFAVTVKCLLNSSFQSVYTETIRAIRKEFRELSLDESQLRVLIEVILVVLKLNRSMGKLFISCVANTSLSQEGCSKLDVIVLLSLAESHIFRALAVQALVLCCERRQVTKTHFECVSPEHASIVVVVFDRLIATCSSCADQWLGEAMAHLFCQHAHVRRQCIASILASFPMGQHNVACDALEILAAEPQTANLLASYPHCAE